MFPNPYDKQLYIKWHETKFKNDAPLVAKLEVFRESLKSSTLEDLEFLGELLYYIIPLCKKEYKIQTGLEFEYSIPLKDALKQKEGLQYDFLFKSTDSIINKLWRKNKTEESVNLSNIKHSINDLVRTEVICSSLAVCNFISQRLITDNINLPSDYKLTKKLKEKIISIDFEPEMKMASGYFAYHGSIKFTSGLIVELQIYSSLTNTWRKLSHKLYEKVRLRPINNIDFGTSEARLISLGHLLHLAECEAQRLEKEIK
jgi:ppGpp synthetase/RelA/SpoT-type nucleotidyltranferase